MNQEKEVLLSLLLEKYALNKNNNYTYVTLEQRSAPQKKVRKRRINPSNAPKYMEPWTSIEDIALIEAVNQNKTIKEICFLLGRSENSIKSRLDVRMQGRLNA